MPISPSHTFPAPPHVNTPVLYVVPRASKLVNPHSDGPDCRSRPSDQHGVLTLLKALAQCCHATAKTISNCLRICGTRATFDIVEHSRPVLRNDVSRYRVASHSGHLWYRACDHVVSRMTLVYVMVYAVVVDWIDTSVIEVARAFPGLVHCRDSYMSMRCARPPFKGNLFRMGLL